MKKLLVFAIVFSFVLTVNNVIVAQDASGQLPAKVSAPVLDQDLQDQISTTMPSPDVVREEAPASVVQQDCCDQVLPRPCPLLRPFVRRAGMPCIANPCNPCPPEPVCAPAPRKLCPFSFATAQYGVPQYAAPQYATSCPSRAFNSASCGFACSGVAGVAVCGDSANCGYDDDNGYGHFPRLRGFFARFFAGHHGFDPHHGDGFGYPNCGVPAVTPYQSLPLNLPEN